MTGGPPHQNKKLLKILQKLKSSKIQVTLRTRPLAWLLIK